MLANIWLKRERAPIIAWPEHLIENVSAIRERYIAAIKLADQSDYDLVITMHREFQEQPSPAAR
jgi:hypothetical protein